MRKSTRILVVALFGLALALLAPGASAAPAQAAGVTKYVDNNLPLCNPGAVSDIQTAINAVPTTGTVFVCPGIYLVPVTGGVGLNISNKTNFKLMAKGTDVQIWADTGADGTIIKVTDSTKVTISGFYIDNNNSFVSGTVADGIGFYNSSGTITKNYITRMAHAPVDNEPEGNGIVATAPTGLPLKPVTISKNTIFDAQYTGIVVDGGIKATITNNFIHVYGPSGSIPYGMTLHNLSGGTVSNNRIIGDWPPSMGLSTEYNSGIYLYQSSKVTIKANRILGFQVGIVGKTWCDVNDGVTNNGLSFNTISGNRFVDNGRAVELRAIADDAFSVCPPQAVGNKILSNTMSALYLYGDHGVFFVPDSTASTVYTAVIDFNQVKSNTIMGYNVPLDLGPGTSNINSKNKVKLPAPGLWPF